MLLRKRKSGLDKRIQRLEKELTQVRGDMRRLNRSVRDPGRPGRQPRLRSLERRSPSPGSLARAAREEQAAVPEDSGAPPPERDLFLDSAPSGRESVGGSLAQPPPEAKRGQEDLFSFAPGVRPDEPVALSGPAAEPDARPVHDETARYWEANRLDSRDQRFATYFMSGGLKSMAPMRVERRIQRNRAILMIIILAVVAFMFWKIIH
ncbi:MAG: hypothetical protein JXR37_18150 [Kiritimatiellae bacterium]|nr:hypothetical protein [Kiritimatiellia bacterium]